MCISAFSVLFQLPLPQILDLLPQPDIAGMSTGYNLPFIKGSKNCTAFFLYMGAPHKLTLAQVGTELPKCPFQLLLPQQLHAFRVKGGKAGGIGHHSIRTKAVQLHMPGGVAAASQLFTDLPYLKLKSG